MIMSSREGDGDTDMSCTSDCYYLNLKPQMDDQLLRPLVSMLFYNQNGSGKALQRNQRDASTPKWAPPLRTLDFRNF